MNDILWSIVFIFIAIAFSTSGTLIFRKKFGHEHLSRHNEVAGFIYAVIGVIYAVLLAFTTILVWEDYQEAERFVEKECSTLLQIFDLSMNSNSNHNLMQEKISDYVDEVIERDWKAFSENKDLSIMPSEKAYRSLRNMIYLQAKDSSFDDFHFQEFVKLSNQLGEDRSMRLNSTKLSIKPFIWYVIIIGGILIVIYGMLFSTENLWSQILMMSVLSLTITLVIELIFSLNHPYRGIIFISTENFELIKTHIENYSI